MNLVELERPIDQRGVQNGPSKLMHDIARAVRNGGVHNACPFGCVGRAVDDKGYCKHLVGFSEDCKTYEPMVMKKGRRVVQVPLVETKEMEMGDEGEMQPIMVPAPLPCQPRDLFIRISTSFRVYREEVTKPGPMKKVS
jgi:hypothetical protein